MRTISVILITLLAWTCAEGVELVSLEIEFREAWQDKPDSFIVADYQKVNLLLGEENQIFLGNTSLALTPHLSDFNTLQIQAEFYTLPPNIQSSFKQVTLKKNQAVEALQVRGKPGRFYKIIFMNWEVSKEEVVCAEDPFDTSLWATDFSVHFNFHYLKNSLADYYWNYNKDYLENQFTLIRKLYGVYPITKLEFYYHHCFYPKINWNQQLGVALFPAKKGVHIRYGLGVKSLDTPNMHIFMLLNQWGYAPLYLTHGLSGFFTLNHYYTRQYLRELKLIPLDSLFNSASYRRQDQKIAYYEAASWVRFLMDKFGPDQMIDFYKEVSDINVKELAEKYFGQLEKLQADWLNFLKNYRPNTSDLHFFAKLATGLRNYAEALALYQELDKNYPEHSTTEDLANAYYLVGDYSGALEGFQKLAGQDSLDPSRLYVLGNMLWLNGELLQAEKEYRQALALDPDFGPAYLALAKMSCDSGEYQACQNYLERVSQFKLNPQEGIEYYLVRAEMHQILGQKILADSTSRTALRIAKNFLGAHPDESLPYLQMGRAYLAGDSLDQALSYLRVAELLEDRPYYLGQVYLYLGELYLKKKESQTAREYLQAVLDTPSGFREKSLAQKLLARL